MICNLQIKKYVFYEKKYSIIIQMCGCGGGARKVRGKKVYKNKKPAATTTTARTTKKYTPKLKPNIKRILNKKKLKK